MRVSNYPKFCQVSRHCSSLNRTLTSGLGADTIKLDNQVLFYPHENPLQNKADQK